MVNSSFKKQPEGCIGISENVYLHGKVFKWVFLATVVLQVLFLNSIS